MFLRRFFKGTSSKPVVVRAKVNVNHHLRASASSTVVCCRSQDHRLQSTPAAAGSSIKGPCRFKAAMLPSFSRTASTAMQADSGKEQSLSAVLLMNRIGDRWLLQQPITSHAKPFPARHVTPTRLSSARAAVTQLSPMRQEDGSGADDALQVTRRGRGHAVSCAGIL